tara:strand:- start:211 stop:411 length:201 start_codon:yes stop_codon:yes gene_type:complete
MLVKLRQRGMTPTLIALTMDVPYDEVIAAMDRLKLPRKRRDRMTVISPDYVVVRSPSPPRQFSWQT